MNRMHNETEAALARIDDLGTSDEPSSHAGREHHNAIFEEVAGRFVGIAPFVTPPDAPSRDFIHIGHLRQLAARWERKAAAEHDEGLRNALDGLWAMIECAESGQLARTVGT